MAKINLFNLIIVGSLRMNIFSLNPILNPNSVIQIEGLLTDNIHSILRSLKVVFLQKQFWCSGYPIDDSPNYFLWVQYTLIPGI